MLHIIGNLALEVCLVLLVEQPEAVPVGPLGVGVDVHLDDAIADGGAGGGVTKLFFLYH